MSGFCGVEKTLGGRSLGRLDTGRMKARARRKLIRCTFLFKEEECGKAAETAFLSPKGIIIARCLSHEWALLIPSHWKELTLDEAIVAQIMLE